MTVTRTLVEAVHARLREYGVDCTVRHERSPLVRADATLALRWAGSHQRFSLYAMPAIRLSEVLAARDEAVRAMVTAPWISPRMGEQLREAGVCYVDSVGNASVRFGTVLIEVAGRPRPPRAERTGGADRAGMASEPAAAGRRTSTLLTPANRRVVAALLDDPSLPTATLREIAAVAGVSLGQAHKAVALLADAGFHRDRLSDDQRAALADVLAAVDGLGASG
ncbi:hypothetical protein AB3X52_04185 [Nocardioides sp. DS6]|uniref:MarR family transcriptional regulator n=1 Tax=Nocardioides eburneus TaxID=3231482 RepID=A0ABV3SW79_9ACTN